jgi:predicted phage terminase large subunit-like protein
MNTLDLISPREYDAVLRTDFYEFAQRCFLRLNPGTPFLPSWYLELIAAKLEACRLGHCRRLIINIPPRSGKSILTSVAFPAWLLGHDPTTRIICASYNMDLAGTFASHCLNVIDDEFFKRNFSRTRLTSKRPNVTDLITTRQGGRLATSVNGALTGFGGNYIILDDPLKPNEAISDALRNGCNAWFKDSLLSRLDNQNTGVIIIVMQRVHLDDLTGHVLEQGGWEVLKLPAIATETEHHRICTPYGEYTHVRHGGEALHPELLPRSRLDELRRQIGEYPFGAQYQQEPVPLGGGVVKLAWLRFYEPDDLPKNDYQIVQSWDTANTANKLSDFTVCTTWLVHDKRAFLLDLYRDRLEYPELKRAVARLSKQYEPDAILIEDKASGTQLLQELKAENVRAVQGIVPKGDKVTRMLEQTGMIEEGRMLLPRAAEWVTHYIAELTSFPQNKHADQVDSTSQALAWMVRGVWGPGKNLYYMLKAEHERLVQERAEKHGRG